MSNAESQLVVEPLGNTHDRAAFSRGVEQLDRYLRQTASQDIKRRVAAVFVGCMASAPTIIVGYYSLSALSIVTSDLPPELTKRLPRYEVQPAILLGRLAIDQRFKGQGFGGLLLLSALQRSLHTSQQVGAMAVVVDAFDESAASFYERHDFRRFPDQPLRLFCPMPTIAAMFEE